VWASGEPLFFSFLVFSFLFVRGFVWGGDDLVVLRWVVACVWRGDDLSVFGVHLFVGFC
jgi:hypothetical protein